jgi:hypothetical protein
MTLLYTAAWVAIAASLPVLMAGAWMVQQQWRYRDRRLLTSAFFPRPPPASSDPEGRVSP